MTDRELLRRHIEAVWNVAHPPFPETTQDFELSEFAQGVPPWTLYIASFSASFSASLSATFSDNLAAGAIASSATTQVTIWRRDVPPEQRALLLTLADHAGLEWDPALQMRREVVFSAPVLTPQQRESAAQLTRVLTAADSDLVESFSPGSASYYLNPRMAPCIGVIVAGELVSIAHSSGRTATACELGIATAPAARRRGYAAAATIRWTSLIQEQGLEPIYSAFAWNTASLQLAQMVGYTQRIASVYGPVPEDVE